MEPDTIVPSFKISKQVTWYTCPSNFLPGTPFSMSHMIKLLSLEPFPNYIIFILKKIKNQILMCRRDILIGYEI